MTALFDRPWQERLLDGDTEAALQLARSVLQPLYEYCQRQLTDRQATQQVVRNTLVRAIHEIRDYDPEIYGGQIWDWVVALAALELESVAAPHSTPRNASLETEVGLPWGPPPDVQFIYRVETDVCLEARRKRDASGEEVEPVKRSVRREEVAITCPGCGHAYHISVTRLGHRMRCGHCDRTFEATAGDLVVPSVPPGPEQADLPVSVVAPPLPHESPPDKRRIARKVPKKIARFEIRAHLGSGSFGDVFRAYDPVLDREVALKLATSAALDSDRARPLVLQEPKAAANLRHPNIVAVHDAGFDGDHFYMAIDLIDGCTLREKLRQGSLDRDTAMRLVTSLAEALDYAHRSKVLHRDVKPSNIMIDSSGQALLMDFGLARIEHSAGEQKQAEHGLLGTPGYMPPEQISRDYGAIGPHSDQYSLGAVFYELLCGQPPFVGPESVLVANTLHAEPLRPHEKDETIDLDLEAICLKTLARKPSDRYASCEALAEDLRRYQADLPTQARPLGFCERLVRFCRRERALSSALGACTSLLLLFVVTLAITTVIKTRLSRTLADAVDEKTRLVDQVEESLGKATAASIEADKARLQADKARLQADKNLAVTYFRHGHTLCDNGQIPEGLVYLVESLDLAEQAQASEVDAQSLAALIRLSLATWHRELHELRAMLTHRLDGQDHAVHCVAVDPAGRLAVTVSRSDSGGVVWFWNLAGKTLERLQDPMKTHETIEAIALAHDGQVLASVGRTADFGCVVRMWFCSGTDGQWHAGEAWLTDAQARYQAVAFSPDGTRLVAAGHDGTEGIVHEWRVDTREVVHTYYQGPVTPQCVAYSPDGEHLAIGMADAAMGEPKVITYTTSNGKMRWQDKNIDGVVYDVTFSHDSKKLAASSGTTWKGDARTWFVSDGNPTGNRLTHLSPVTSVDFSPDDKFVVTGSQDRSARLWDLDTGRLLGHPLWHDHEVRDIVFVPGADAGRPLALVSISDDVARLWHVALGTPALGDRVGPTVLDGAKIPGREREQLAVVGAVNFSAGNLRLYASDVFPLNEVSDSTYERKATCVAAGTEWGIVGLADGSALRVNWDTQEMQPFAENHWGSVLCAAMSRDGRYGATAGEDGQTLLWDMSTRALVARVKDEPAGNVNVLAFDPLNQHIVLAAGTDGQVRFWNGETGEPIGKPLSQSAAVSCAAYSDDGLTLVVGLVSGVQIWHRDSADADWERGKPLQTEIGVVRVQVWSPRQLVATGDVQGNLRFWHMTTGEPIGPSLANQGSITVLVGSEDHVLSGTTSGSVRRWPLPVTIVQDLDHLKLWIATITGEELGEEQVIQRLGVDRWQAIARQCELIGEVEIDRTISRDGTLHLRPVPQPVRIGGESAERRSELQDMLRTSLTERPTFRPPPLEYLDRYLPADTEGLIGLDVRQVVAAPLVWLVGMSLREVLFLPPAWKEWLDSTGFQPLLDPHYVLLAASRHSVSRTSWESGRLPALTMVVKGEFDLERLWGLARRLAEREPDVIRLSEGPPGVPVLLFQPIDPSEKFGNLCVCVALVEEEDGGTLIASLSRETVERALVVTAANRLDQEFRACVESTDRNHSLWFAARKDVIDTETLAQFEAFAEKVGSPVIPERMDGNLTVFVSFEYTVRATYLDSQAAQAAPRYVRSLAAMLSDSTAGEDVPIDWHTEVEGPQVVLCGNYLQAAATQWRPPTELDTLMTRVPGLLPRFPVIGMDAKLVSPVVVSLEVLAGYVFKMFWRSAGSGGRRKPSAPKKLSREQQEEIARAILDRSEKKRQELGTATVFEELNDLKRAYPGTEAAAAASRLLDEWLQEKALTRAGRWLGQAESALQAGDKLGAVRLFNAIVDRHPGTIEAEKAEARLKEIEVSDRSRCY